MKPGTALAAMRRTSWHACLSCGNRFSGIKTAKFCSNACRQRAKYAKNVTNTSSATRENTR